MNNYFKIYKPYGVLSQFTDKEDRPVLSSIFNFPSNAYPIGRLDMDSEGLLIITDDKILTDRLLNPANKVEKEYFVQVEGVPEEQDLKHLRRGVLIQNKLTLPAIVNRIDVPLLPERIPPIRIRKNIPDSWLSITIHEGRNRQIRKMCAAVGYPVLRLVRIRINRLHLGKMQPGEVKKLNDAEVKLLKNLSL
jgi:23S rRNA pseudouridine2457 synthase